ncbi:hypothetical protein L249_8316, partial [Ophiocordyceps polyrhachis-furcata BCC 54312]
FLATLILNILLFVMITHTIPNNTPSSKGIFIRHPQNTMSSDDFTY